MDYGESHGQPDASLRHVMRLKPYFEMVKPGIVFGNLISTCGGFSLAARGQIDPLMLLSTLAGVALVVASGAIFNNIIDRNIDAKMKRTQFRLMAQGLISPTSAARYGLAFGSLGMLLLFRAGNLLPILLAFLGLVIYVGFYSFALKRRSPLAAFAGSLSGAMPPVIGYCAASGRFDLGAASLLLMFALWQIPHAYVIALLCDSEFACAGLPTLARTYGATAAKRIIAAATFFFIPASLMPFFAKYTGYTYLAVALLLGLYWFRLALGGFRAADGSVWARKMFFFSLLVMVILSAMMSFDFRRFPQA